MSKGFLLDEGEKVHLQKQRQRVKRCNYKDRDNQGEKVQPQFFWGSCNRWWPISSQAERSIWLYCLSWTTLCRAFDRFRRENKFFSECTSRLSEVIQAVLRRQRSGFIQRKPTAANLNLCHSFSRFEPPGCSEIFSLSLTPPTGTCNIALLSANEKQKVKYRYWLTPID